MALSDSSRLGRSALLLLPVIALAFYIAFIPKLGYHYPVHIDEWVHIAHNNALLQTGSLDYPDPFSGGGGGGMVASLESGFHVLFAVFYRISGMSWIDISLYFPGIILAFTAVSVYVLARREGFGWEAAFFACLIPTTVGIMGPAFFVPIALCLPFIPLSLFLVFNYRSWGSYLILFLFMGFLIITHTTSAVCFIVILAPGILMYLVKEPRHGLTLLLMGLVPFLLTLPWTYGLIVSTARSLLISQPLPANHDLPIILRTYGYIPFILGLLGVFWLAFKGGVKNYNLVFGLLVIVAMLAVFYTLHYGVALIYLRGIHYALLMFGIAAGAFLMVLKNIKLPDSIRIPDILRRVGYPVSLALIIVVLVVAIPGRLRIPYYHMIDENDYGAFVWIEKNCDSGYNTAILDPWKATAFTAITGKYVYARTHEAPTGLTLSVDKFLSDNCMDTALLVKNGIDIVYTRGECHNPDLVKIHEGVYLLKSEQVK